MICCVFFKCSTNTRRLPLTNRLLIVPDGDTPEESRNVSLKLLYEMFKDTKSHGLVFLQFLCALNIFSGRNISLMKNALTEFYYNLSFEMLSGSRDFIFEAISDLTADMSFQVKDSMLLNLKKKVNRTKKAKTILKILIKSLGSQGMMENLKIKLKRTFLKCLSTQNRQSLC